MCALIVIFTPENPHIVSLICCLAIYTVWLVLLQWRISISEKHPFTKMDEFPEKRPLNGLFKERKKLEGVSFQSQDWKKCLFKGDKEMFQTVSTQGLDQTVTETNN